MANALYTKGKEALLSGAVNLGSDTIKAVPVDATYTPVIATDAHLSDIAGGKRVATPVALASKAVTGGAFTAADTTFPAIAGAAVRYVVIYKDSGVEATSQLLALFDTVTGLPYTPVGNDLVLHWNTGANKIFAI